MGHICLLHSNGLTPDDIQCDTHTRPTVRVARGTTTSHSTALQQACAAAGRAAPPRPPCPPCCVKVGFFNSASEDKFFISKMIVTGRSARLSWLIFFVSAALLGVSSGACNDDPSDCSTCAACTTAVSSSTQLYYWVQTDPNSEDVGDGTCVQRFDPVGSSTVRTADMPGLCGKRVFIACSGGTVASLTRNCPVTPGVKSAASQLKISSFVTASLVSSLAFYLIFN